jgi:hypothetical protein
MRNVLSVTAGALCLLPIAGFADPCAEVVADTLAEMRAGADGWWSDDVQNLVRAAAGSACIKAQSGRYGATPQSAGEAMSISAVGAASDEAGTQPKQGSDTPDTGGEAQETDDGSWSVGGLTFRSMSGSPTQKPYERQRQSKKEEQ